MENKYSEAMTDDEKDIWTAMYFGISSTAFFLSQWMRMRGIPERDIEESLMKLSEHWIKDLRLKTESPKREVTAQNTENFLSKLKEYWIEFDTHLDYEKPNSSSELSKILTKTKTYH